MCVAYPPSSPHLITKRENEGVFLCNVCEVAWEVDEGLFLSTYFENLRELK